MKIEMSESLCYSYLRHVKRCWLVQTNWKSSKHWETHEEENLQEMFQAMKGNFDKDGKVFKQTKTASQFMKQGEIDTIGIDQQGEIHALDVAFHEGGLLYQGGTVDTVLKKLLRIYMLLQAYGPYETKFHIYFASPKVNPRDQKPLEEAFCKLQSEYPKTNWMLIINNDFTEQMVQTTLDKADKVADTSELFVRASKLLELSRSTESVRYTAQASTEQ